MTPTQTTAEGFRLIGEHRDGCFAERDKDGLTFIVHAGIRCDLNRNGVGRGSTIWHVFRCNNLRCDAQMLVRWDTLSRFVTSRGESA